VTRLGQSTFVSVLLSACSFTLDFADLDKGSDGGSGDAGTSRGCADAPDAWVFCNDFENGLGTWDDSDGNPPSTNAIVTEDGGNHAMLLRAGDAGFGGDVVKVLPALDAMYARWRFQWQDGFDFAIATTAGTVNSGGRNHLGDVGHRPTGGDFFSAQLGAVFEPTQQLQLYDPGLYQDCPPAPGTCNADALPCTADEGATYCTVAVQRATMPLPTVVTGRWYCLELEVSAGAPTASGVGASGAVDYWVDGVEQGPWSGIWFRSSADLAPNVLWLRMLYDSGPRLPGVLVDDVVVSTARIGCD